LKCVKMPDVSRAVPCITPVSDRTSPLSATPSAVMSRNSTAMKSRGSLPVCGDSFYEDSEADQNCSSWSFAQAAIEFSSFDVINMESHDSPSVLSSSSNMRSCEVSPAGPSTCTFERMRSSSLQCQTSTVTPQSCDITDSRLMSRQLSKTPVPNNLPLSDVKTPSTSSAAVTVTACSPPSGLLILCYLLCNQ